MRANGTAPADSFSSQLGIASAFAESLSSAHPKKQNMHAFVQVRSEAKNGHGAAQPAPDSQQSARRKALHRPLGTSRLGARLLSRRLLVLRRHVVTCPSSFL